MPNDDYEASPQTADTPLSIDEVRGLHAGDLKWLRDKPKATHFVRRVVGTLMMNQDRLRQMQRGIEQLSAQSATAGAQSTLHPAAAARFLPAEQIAELADEHIKRSVLAANQARKDADAARRAALAELNRLRYAASTMLESPTLTPAAKAEFEKLLSGLDGIEEELHRQIDEAGESGGPEAEPTDDDDQGPEGLDGLFA